MTTKLPHLLRSFCAGLAIVLLPQWAAAQTSTMVRLHTTQGPIDFKLLDTEAPLTVANFLTYVRSGAYANTLVHRSVPGFIIQGGGYAYGATGVIASHIPTNAPVQNEFSAQRSNLRGTVAMAKLGSNPNSATSEWFVNLANNASNLDNQNGGFTVFARATTPGMVVVDKIAALPRCNCTGVTSAATDMPVTTTPITAENVRQISVIVTRVTEFPALAQQTETDRILNYLEATYPQYLQPSQGEPGNALGYSYRYYAGSNAYVGTKDGNVWFLVPAINGDINLLAPMAALLSQAVQAGY